MPDILLLQSEELAVIDNLSGKLYLIVYADPAQPEAFAKAKRRLAELRATGCSTASTAPAVRRGESHGVEREFGKDDYLAGGARGQGVHRRRRHDAGADRPAAQEALRRVARCSLYRALRSLNPSPYMYFYDFGDFQIVGASPEILVRHEARRTAATRSRSARSPARARAARRPSRTRRSKRELRGRPEGARRARDADRPGAQRHRPHRADRQRQGHRAIVVERYSHVHAHRLQRRGHAEGRHDATSTCCARPSRPAR